MSIAALSIAFIRRREALKNVAAPLVISGAAVIQSCCALAQPQLLTPLQLAPGAAATVLAANFWGPRPGAARPVVLGCGMVMSLAAFFGIGCAAWPLSVGLLSLGLIALQLQRQAELALRKLFLEEQRLAERAHHFYSLLTDMLPTHLIRRYFELCLVGGGPAGIGAVSMGERQPCCGVLFFQICGFDDIIAENSAEHVVRFLNRLFSLFDAACAEEEDGIVKVETVGGQHVSACGIFPSADSGDDFDAQLAALARVALRMHSVAADFSVSARAGLHCGPVVAGIVGDKLPRFRLFGDTVNVAARFQSQCPEGSVLLSEAASARLECKGMETLPNGSVEMKGLGEVQTYLLVARMNDAADTSPSPSATIQAALDGMPPATLLTTRPTSLKKRKSVTWHGVAFDDETGSEDAEESSNPRRCDSAPCVKFGQVHTWEFDNESEEGRMLHMESAPSRIGFHEDMGSPPITPTPSIKAVRSSKSLTRTRFSVSSSQTSQRFSISQDHEEEEFATPAHTRTKTPTAWLSFGSQLGQDVDDTPDTDSDDGALVKFESDKSWMTADEGGADTGALRRRSSRSAASGSFGAPTPIHCRSQQDLEPHGGISLGEEVVQRLEEALQEEAGLLAGLLPHFGVGAEEKAFRLEQALRSLAASTAAAPHAIAAAVSLLVLCAVAVESPPALLLAAAAFALAALALARRRQTTIVTASAKEQVAASACYEDQRFAELQTGLAAWSLAGACALAAWGCGGSLGSLVPWAWMLLALLQRPPLRVALSASVVHAGLAVLCGSTVHVAAPTALLVLQRADERVERRRYKVHQLGTILSNLEAVAENLMPPSVVRELREKRFGRTPSASPCGELRCVSHRYDLLTVLQADLVGFTAFARTKMPEEVVCVVNGLFSIFDRSVEQRGAYKMETIGDAYICVSGLPDYGGGVHSASAMLFLALDFVDAVAQYKALCGLPETLGLRVGVHSGSCVGGVVGTTMQRYHLFGRTMHVAEVLESTARTDCVHLSQRTKDHADLEEMTTQLRFLPMCPPQKLLTSKGETVPPEAIGSLATFMVTLVAAEQHQASALAITTRSRAFSSNAASPLPLARGAVLDEPAARRLEQLDLAVQWHTAVARRGGARPSEENIDDLLSSCTTPRISARRCSTVG